MFKDAGLSQFVNSSNKGVDMQMVIKGLNYLVNKDLK